MSDLEQTCETLEGYVVDLACLRRYPQVEAKTRAEVHTTECALMGHCVESGYGLVDQEGRVIPLDTHATPLVVAVLGNSHNIEGVRLSVQREIKGTEMQTIQIEEV